jgi:hypothetical protein
MFSALPLVANDADPATTVGSEGFAYVDPANADATANAARLIGKAGFAPVRFDAMWSLPDDLAAAANRRPDRRISLVSQRSRCVWQTRLKSEIDASTKGVPLESDDSTSSYIDTLQRDAAA